MGARLSRVDLGVVALGGAVGTLARYGLGQLSFGPGQWPWATFLANLGGSLLLGAAVAVLGPDPAGSRRLGHLLVGAGFCGALTTYSALAVEVDELLRAGAVEIAAVYGGASVVLGIGMFAVGFVLAQRVRPRS